MSSTRRNVHALQRSISKDFKKSFDDNLLTAKTIIMPLKPVNKTGMKDINKLDMAKLTAKDAGSKGKKQGRKLQQRSQSKKSLQRDQEMPLKQSVNSMLHMKREAKKGFYSNKKEDDFHHFGTLRSSSNLSHSKNAPGNFTSREERTASKKPARKSSRPKSLSSTDPKLAKYKSKSQTRKRPAQKSQSAEKPQPEPLTPAKPLPKKSVLAEDSVRGDKKRSEFSAKRLSSHSAKRFKPKNVEYFDKELTFTPSINKHSKDIDKKKGGYGGYDRIELLRIRGQEYDFKREKLKVEKDTRELEESSKYPFKPELQTKYNSKFSSDMKFEDRSQAWKRRRDQKVEHQRLAMKKQKDFEENHLPLKSTQDKRDQYFKSHGVYSEMSSPSRHLTEEEYMDIRLKSIRKSAEKHISNHGSPLRED